MKTFLLINTNIQITMTIIIIKIIFLLNIINLSNSILIIGSDYNNNDLLPNDGDTLSGIFTNVNLFSVQAFTYIQIEENKTLYIECNNAVINGIIYGKGKGHSGGEINTLTSSDGLIGEGIGGGGPGRFLFTDPGGIPSTGGGGGGFSGNGGNSSTLSIDYLLPGIGGSMYGSINDFSAPKGSGGGSGANPRVEYDTFGGKGGNGGGSFVLKSLNWINITNTSINMDGESGYEPILGYANDFGGPGGGGGSGGTIILFGVINMIDSFISTYGGIGGDGIFKIEPIGESGGGGGSGGMIKLYGELFNDDDSLFNIDDDIFGDNRISYSGGLGGASYGIDGLDGFIDSVRGDDGLLKFNEYTITANNDNIIITDNNIKKIYILDNDISNPIDSISIYNVIIIEEPISGEVSININDNAINYNPYNQHTTSIDQFKYKLCRNDIKLICNEAIVFLTINNLPPIITSIPPDQYIEGNQLYEYFITSIDPENQKPLTISVNNTLIMEESPWLQLVNINTNKGTALLTGIAPLNTNQIINIKIYATDAANNINEQSFLIEVYNNLMYTQSPTPTITPSNTIKPLAPISQSTPSILPINNNNNVSPTPTHSIKFKEDPLNDHIYGGSYTGSFNNNIEVIKFEDYNNNNGDDSIIKIPLLSNNQNELNNNNNIIGNINIPKTIINEGFVLVIIQGYDTYYFDTYNTVSSIIDLTLFDSNDNEINNFEDPIEICLEVDQSTINKNNDKSDNCSNNPKSDTNYIPCLSFLNDFNKWECIDDNLKSDNNLLCGKTNHFTNFAILLNGNTEKCNSSENYITGNLIYDLIIILSIICIIIILSLIIIITFSHFYPFKKILYGKEGWRIINLRNSQRRHSSMSDMSDILPSNININNINSSTPSVKIVEMSELN
jgi:hypothetical protein